MRIRRQLILQIPAILLLVSAGPAPADQLVTRENVTHNGRLRTYEDGKFVFESTGGALQTFSADQVARITTEGSAGGTDPVALAQAVYRLELGMAAVLQRLDRIDSGVGASIVQQQHFAEQDRERMQSLDPTTRLSVSRDKGEYTRSGEFKVQGTLYNGSSVTIFDPRLRVELVAASGQAVASREIYADRRNLGPDAVSLFSATFTNPPPFKTYRITPLAWTDLSPQEQAANPAPPFPFQQRAQENTPGR